MLSLQPSQATWLEKEEEKQCLAEADPRAQPPLLI